MPMFYEILPAPKIDQEAFILDHGKKVDGVLKYQDDLTSYGWNIKQFNKMHVGAFVLSRRPGKLTKDRKFEIYAGGYVESISDPDEDGNVVAVITNPFEIIPPIKQGDTFLENFKWDSKKRNRDSWEHFWNQYGMNTISYTDFERLLRNANCVPIGEKKVVTEDSDITDDELKDLEENEFKGFNVIFEENGATHRKKEKKYSGVARKIDYDRIQKAKNKNGALAEEIVMDILTIKAIEDGCMKPIHASKVEGDGLGYDIRAYDVLGNEKHIEVKSTKSNYVDGFEMSYNEIAASLDPNYEYQIYRVYSLNPKTKECRIKIYDGPVNEEKYKLVSTKVAVYQK